jgi:hypothetical protein
LIFRKAIFDCDILTFEEACFLQALAERGGEVRRVSERCGAKKSNYWYCRLLRLRADRPSRRAAKGA